MKDKKSSRHFVKQMNKETKLKIHKITAKAALKFGSKSWMLKERKERGSEAAQMKFLRHLLGIAGGLGLAEWLSRCATNQTVPGSIPGGVTVFFSDVFPSDRTMVDSAPS
jgi:hypothetical protein